MALVYKIVVVHVNDKDHVIVFTLENVPCSTYIIHYITIIFKNHLTNKNGVSCEIF